MRLKARGEKPIPKNQSLTADSRVVQKWFPILGGQSRLNRMIPPFDDSGGLPPGVHAATLAEIDERFGRTSELRRVQMESVRWMIELARRAGVQRIILNGSFVTDIMEPNDVDCVLLIPPGKSKDAPALRELRAGLPFIDMAIVRSTKRFDTLYARPTRGAK